MPVSVGMRCGDRWEGQEIEQLKRFRCSLDKESEQSHYCIQWIDNNKNQVDPLLVRPLRLWRLQLSVVGSQMISIHSMRIVAWSIRCESLLGVL